MFLLWFKTTLLQSAEWEKPSQTLYCENDAAGRTTFYLKFQIVVISTSLS